MQSAAIGGGSVKEQVVDFLPKRIKEVRFGVLSNQEIVNQAVIEVSSRELYTLDRNRQTSANGPLDGRLGTSSKTLNCDTCGDSLQTCNGHFGYIKLALPVFHIGYFKMIIATLQEICKDCARILLTENEIRSFLRDLRRPHIDNLRRSQILKKINARCRKTKACYYCGAVNGVVRKAAGPLKIIHDKYRAFNASTAAKKQPPESKILFDRSFEEAAKQNHELEKHVKKALDDLNPLRVLKLFERIPNTEVELLGINTTEESPEMLIWQYVPVPPVCIRPSVAQDAASTEDDLTTKLGDIVHMSSLLRQGLVNGQPIQTIMEQWDYLQVQVAMYINSDIPGLLQAGNVKAMRGLCQRLKGKQGRFRGNLSGKRVDFSGRTVISPDPNLGIDQVAVPLLVAKNLTYPERVSQTNIEKLKKRVRNGANRWPGANYLIKKNLDNKLFLKYGDLEKTAKYLKIGDIVERHLEDGDIVLFNRQPSLHKLSILSHFVKVRPWRTFRLNECVCNPYNADFDGDEMNLHVPQTEEARTEAMQLMGVKHNLLTPKNGEPIIAAIQDFITAAYLLTRKDNFYNRKAFAAICMSMVDGSMTIDIPPPAIVKPQALWTGKQVFNILIRPNKTSPVRINLDAPTKQFKPEANMPRDLCENDGWVSIRNSEVMCGRIDKFMIGQGPKDSVFYVILRDYGPDEAVRAMNRLAKFSARWLTNEGFSIGISDVFPGGKLVDLKQELIEKAYKACNDIIEEYREGRLENAAGCNKEQTMENKISGLLNRVRQDTGKTCIQELSRHNAPLIMALSGSKGSQINVAQMVAVVGQQIIGGQRVPDGFQDRSLPHFPKNARQPPSKGFVRNSFFSGLNPTEFLFHAISGREGLVDTAVKTAETGYMSRRLIKSLEDLSTQYDDTVRNASAGVVQFQYGEDKLDPVDMEGKAKPVNFDRTFIHAESTTYDKHGSGLLPAQIVSLCEELLEPEKAKLNRTTLTGEKLSYLDRSDAGIDQLESARDFLQAIHDYVAMKADQIKHSRQLLHVPTSRKSSAKDAEVASDQVAKVSIKTLECFVRLCLKKYKRAQVEPGHAVGAVGAQSIGEPGTQMTLKTFHFAGVAGMSITQGVPRIKEIINASKIISTPVITCELEDHIKSDVRKAREVKGRIEKTYISDVIVYIEDNWSSRTCFLEMQIDFDYIAKMRLEIDLKRICDTLVDHRKLKLSNQDVIIHNREVRVYIRGHPAIRNAGARGKASKAEEADAFTRLHWLKRVIPTIAVCGYPEASRAIIKTDESNNTNTLLIEGYGLRACMTTPGVVGTKTRSNSVLETYSILGIEAARSTIVSEINLVMGDMDIDPRHMQLLADVMTYKGEILGITRFGLAKMRDSVLQLASFEKTPDHLFEAGFRGKTDKIEGVSECIIMGQGMRIGTGAFGLLRPLKVDGLGTKSCLFEETWEVWRKEDLASRKAKRVVDVNMVV